MLPHLALIALILTFAFALPNSWASTLNIDSNSLQAIQSPGTPERPSRAISERKAKGRLPEEPSPSRVAARAPEAPIKETSDEDAIYDESFTDSAVVTGAEAITQEETTPEASEEKAQNERKEITSPNSPAAPLDVQKEFSELSARIKALEAQKEKKAPQDDSKKTEQEADKNKTQAKAKPQGPYVIPKTQVKAITYRIRLVKQIVKEFGMAYDYRSYTKKELETILKTKRKERLKKKRLKRTSS